MLAALTSGRFLAGVLAGLVVGIMVPALSNTIARFIPGRG